jgi:transposase
VRTSRRSTKNKAGKASRAPSRNGISGQRNSRIDPVKDAAKTIKRHWSGVLRWYDSKINNGILEGLNSLVQAAKAKARGYRTFKNLKTMIYMLTGKLDYSMAGLPI